jgi:hypothetical protein
VIDTAALAVGKPRNARLGDHSLRNIVSNERTARVVVPVLLAKRTDTVGYVLTQQE